jgi:hypothetical protein
MSVQLRQLVAWGQLIPMESFAPLLKFFSVALVNLGTGNSALHSFKEHRKGRVIDKQGLEGNVLLNQQLTLPGYREFNRIDYGKYVIDRR